MKNLSPKIWKNNFYNFPPTCAYSICSLLIILILTLPACSLFFGEDDGLKRCSPDNYNLTNTSQCGPLHHCVNMNNSPDTPPDYICLSRDPVEASAMAAVFVNKRTKVCYERGHDFSGIRTKTHRMPVGVNVPDCDRVWQTKQCARC